MVMIAATNHTKVDYNTSIGTLYDGFEQSVDLPNKQINDTFSSEFTNRGQRESSNKKPKET